MSFVFAPFATPAPRARRAAAALLAALATMAHAQPAPGDGAARHGTFKAVQGEVTVVRGEERSAAVVGGALQQADRIVTGAKSAASLALRDGTLLSVGPQSVVDLAQFRFDPTTQDGNVAVQLVRGTLRMVTGLIAKVNPAEARVTTPTAVIGVRGTDFIVEENP